MLLQLRATPSATKAHTIACLSSGAPLLHRHNGPSHVLQKLQALVELDSHALALGLSEHFCQQDLLKGSRESDLPKCQNKSLSWNHGLNARCIGTQDDLQCAVHLLQCLALFWPKWELRQTAAARGILGTEDLLRISASLLLLLLLLLAGELDFNCVYELSKCYSACLSDSTEMSEQVIAQSCWQMQTSHRSSELIVVELSL
mmetsp:Transcript_29557/g.68790  ORF Transcript_29557/g.68790 Transcript_29557/m.68790 type:complete len:202 (-) Transcript_29557:441-1046(-)